MFVLTLFFTSMSCLFNSQGTSSLYEKGVSKAGVWCGALYEISVNVTLTQEKGHFYHKYWYFSHLSGDAILS